jgi:peptidyl-prolyl cis-trans isomerase B (cyclophilin B)
MSSQKRERELARAKFERQQERRAQRAAKARRSQRIAAGIVVAAIVVAGVGWVAFTTNSSDDSLVASEEIPTELSELDPSATEPSEADSTAVDPAPSEPLLENCTPPGTPRANDIEFPEGPTPISGEATSITFSTNCGDIVIELDPAAPQTIESEVFLAESGFYNNTSCHRLTTEGIFVLQCGDPAGNGSGGPGYTIADENLPTEGEANYPAGTVAMANAGPGTSGSQFFIVYQDTTLPAGYSIWGQVVSGLDIVRQVASAGVAGGLTDGTPAQPVFINSATVS